MNDATDDPALEAKKKPNVLLWLICILVVFLLLFLWMLFGFDPPIVLSKQTTYITSPLRANGMPDYIEWLRREHREGVTHENNAAVLLWQAMWPGELDPGHYQLICDELGIDPVPSGRDSLIGIYNDATRISLAILLHEQRRLSVGGRGPSPAVVKSITGADSWPGGGEASDLMEVVDELIGQAMRRPWTGEELGPLADWVGENQAPLDLLVEAAARPRYYSPSPSQLDDLDDSMIAVLLPGVQMVRQAARALSVRAMWHLGEGRHDEAWQDLLAIHRLARHVGSGPWLINVLVGIAVDGIAIEGTQTLLSDADLTADEARRVERDLASLAAWRRVGDSISESERLWFLDAITRMATGEAYDGDLLGQFFDGVPSVLAAIPAVTSIDWNLVLEQGNTWYDRLTEAAMLPTRAARQAALIKIEDDMAQLSEGLQQPVALAGGIVSRRLRSDVTAMTMLNYFIPATMAAGHAQDRANTRLDLLRLAAALVVYRAEQGAYPAKLEELVPDVVDALPVDIYTGAALVYRPVDEGAGFVLYSMYENGVDDGGTDLSGSVVNGEWVDRGRSVIDRDKSDLVIRLPVPAFTLPEVVADEAAAP